MNESIDQNIQSQIPPQGEQMPPFVPMPPQIGASRPRGWRERWMQRFGMSAEMPRAKELTIPNWLIGKAIVFFFVTMFACWGAYGYIPAVDLILISALSVIIFFYGSTSMAKEWSLAGETSFIRNVFVAGAVVRLIFVLYMYFFFNPDHFGNTYGDSADVDWYIPFGKDLAKWISGDTHQTLSQIIKYNAAAGLCQLFALQWSG